MGWVVINEVQDPVTETIEKVYGRTNVRINTWLNVREVSDNQGGPPECRLWGKSVDEETDVGHALHKKFTAVQVQRRAPGKPRAADTPPLGGMDAGSWWRAHGIVHGRRGAAPD